MTKTLKNRINVNTTTDQSGNNSLAEYHSIPRLNWGHFVVDVKRNGDYLRVGNHFRGRVQITE